MNYKNNIALSAVAAIALAGCGAESTTNVKELPAPALTGQFVDSPVSGLSYSSESFPDGTTDANGEYQYFRGDLITFSIGEFKFPAVPASSILTPLDMFKADTPFNQPVANTLRLLQALDVDANPDNGIEISANAAGAAMMSLTEGQTVEDFFNRPAAEFAADVEPWLTAAGAGSNTLAPFDSALEHFVTYLEQEFGTLFSNTFDISQFNGTVYNPYLSGSTALMDSFNFTPADATETSGSYTHIVDGVEISGSYEFQFGRRALLLTSETESTYIISRSYNTVNQVYSLCVTDASVGLATAVANCDADADAKETLLVLSEAQAQVELEALTERANTVEPALLEEFDTDTDTFFTSGYKRLTDDPNSGALFKKTGGSPAIDSATGQLTLSGARFSIGNAASNPDKETSSSDTYGTGVYNLSEGFTISFDVVSHNSGGSLSLYVDNNTTSQGNSVHGDASKFYGFSINDENLPQGQRFSYTYVPGEDVVTGPDLNSPDARGVLDASVTNSFFQLRTDSSGTIVIDNLKIETVADAVDLEEPTEPEEPEEPEVPTIPRVNLPTTTNYIGVTEDIFSTAYQSLIDATGAEVPLYNRTGGSVTVVADGLEIDSGRFTIGHSTPEVDTTDQDTSATGVFDLSRPYNVVMDIVSVNDPDGDNNFQIYVDNSTSSSSKSMHGGDSKFYSELINTLTPGTTLTVPGLVATKNSFIQLRTESGGTVVINNLRIEYINENILAEEMFETTTEKLFSPDYKAIPGNDTVPMFSITGGGSGLSIADGKLTMDSARFTWGNTTPDVESSADDTVTTGIFDLSKPYKVIFDVVAIDDAEGNNNFQLYVDNNTSSSSKSIHGGDSKFYSTQILDLNPGQTVTVEGLLATETSFLQLRTESGGVVTIDNLRIEYIETNLVLQEAFDTTVEAFFTPEYSALGTDENIPMYSVTGGGSGITITDGQITLDSARITVGNSTPDVESSADDTVTSGVLDLSRPYTVSFDVVAVDDAEGNNGFQIYVDNNTSSSSKSIHGGDSKFYSEQILSLIPGETLTIEGLVATETSFLQFRTESGGIVTIDNLRIEYTDEEESDDGSGGDGSNQDGEISEAIIDLGFAGYNFDVTGGANGMTVTVDTGSKLIAALEEASDANMPVTIYVDGTITDANSGGSGRSIDIKDMDNVSIIGVADRGEFDGIGITIRRANNIIIQNLKIHHVLTGGKDAISVEGDNDGSTTENIWIDHNELYSTMSVDKDYYDGLIDTKSGARNITISYNYLHDHWKASLHGHTEDDSASSNTDRNITFHHNRFENIESRLPLFRYGHGHLYNNYYNEIHSTAINSRIGAELLVENNVFENTQNPIVSFYSDVIGYWNTSGNLFGTGVTWTTPADNDVAAGPDQTPTSSYVVPYDYSLDDVAEVKTKVINNAGVGKIDQSGLDIPAIEEDGGSTPTPVETDVSLPFSEDFEVSDADQLFSAGYKSIPDDASTALYSITGGGSGISVTNGEISLTSARFTLGNSQPGTETADSDTQGVGVFDLSKPYKVMFDLVSVSDPDGNNNLQVYVDNNTSSSGKSMHGGASKFYEEQITTLTPGPIVIDGLVATTNSFLQIRTESGGTVVIDNLRIEYSE
ncbi:pectate lyase family protein [Neptunicella sp. SCSIO 80796]|uniref:pectate lyase family protein n=1 Tax=Neptunicella plasticusilytica TaxID=3117012 RepID=UPI003A4E51EA